MKNNEVIAENTFQNSGVTRRFLRFQHTSSGTKHRSRILSHCFSIYEIVHISIKDSHVGYAATCWKNFLSNLPKTKLHYAIKDS